MRSITTIAAAAALFANYVAAGNTANIYNNCQFPVYAWSVDASPCNDDVARGVMRNPQTPDVIPAGGSFSEVMRSLESGGVSIKLALEKDLYGVPITQLEYTLDPADTWYDVSNVNCHETECPFQPHGLYLESHSNCPTVNCVPGLLTCHGAYTLWDDNWASLCCPHSTDPEPDINLYLCSNSPTTGDDEDDYSVQEEAVSPPAITPHAKKPKPSPTPVEPATRVVEVTEYSTVVVTFTPPPRPVHQRRSRHIHNHAHAHAHHF